MNRAVTIPAAQNNVAGVYTERTNEETVFGVVFSSAAFMAQLGNDQAVQLVTGKSLGAVGGKPFGRVTLTNPSGSAIDVTFYIGKTPFSQTDVSLTSAKTNFVETYEADITNGSSVAFPGARNETISGVQRFVQRRRFMVFNMHATRKLDIGTNSTPDYCGIVYGTDDSRIPFNVDTCETFIIYNNSGGTVHVRVLAIFDIL